MKLRRYSTIIVVVGAFTAIACSDKTSAKKTLIKECVLDDVQQYSLQGKWNKTPVKISFKSGEWAAQDVGAVQFAANTWNTFLTTTRSLQIFDFGTAGTGYSSTANQTVPQCASATINDGVVLYQRTSGWTKSSTAVAVTTTCYKASSAGSLPELFNAIMEFNYTNYFTQKTGKLPDLQSIALHEFGHLLGLDHSCGQLGRPNQAKSNASCPDPNSEPTNPYVEAVMFPGVLFDDSGAGEIKQDLKANDQGRANCVYNNN